MNNEYLFVASEIRELEELLADIPEEQVIERMSLEARLQSAKEILAKLPEYQEVPKAKLIFKGRPIRDSHGMEADFCTKATEAFSDAFAAVAAGLSGKLSHGGRIPDKNKNQLLITSTAIGSFGFEFELPAPLQPQLPEFEKIEEAMEKIETLFRLTAEGSDDDLTEIVEAIHPRATKKVFEFLDLLVKRKAWCGLEFRGQTFSYADYKQIQRSYKRIKDENIQEDTKTYRGEFQGVLPNGRIFEFKQHDQEELIRGKVDTFIDDPGILNQGWLYRLVTIKLHVMRVGGGRPRFTLMSLDDLS